MIGKFYMVHKAALFLCIATPTAIVIKDPGPKVTHAAKRTVAKAKHWTNSAAKRLHRAPVFAEAIAEPKIAADRIDTVIVPAMCPPTDGLLTGGGGGGIGSSGGWWGGGIGGGGNITPGDGGLPYQPGNPGVPTNPGPVPEPGTYLIMGLGLGIIGVRMRRARATERKANG